MQELEAMESPVATLVIEDVAVSLEEEWSQFEVQEAVQHDNQDKNCRSTSATPHTLQL